VQLTRFGQRKPHQLSGGQQQRVALARSLAKRPKMLLLDEPLGALDKKLREETQIELVNIIEDVDVTCVMVTHDQEEAMTMASRIAIMSEGKVLQIGTPADVYETPATRFVADFIGNVNMLDAVVSKAGPAFSLAVPSLGTVVAPGREGVAEGTSGVFVIRPEQVSIRAGSEPSPDPNQFEGRINNFLYVGDVTTYIVDLPGGQRIEALLPNSSPGRAKFFEIGDPVRVSWKAEAGAFLDR
jgi:spermidine/putrescine transport system ATP-binding protein